jgi:hypothetical protein
LKVISKHSKAVLISILTGTLLLWMTNTGLSQDSQASDKEDTVKLHSGDKLILKDTAILYPHDTVLYLPPGSKYKIKQNPVTKSEDFYQKIEEKAAGKKWTKKLYTSVFRKPKDINVEKEILSRRSELAYAMYEGFPIRTIQINRIDVFGPTVYDTTGIHERWFNRTANKLHFNTRAGIIRNSLLFGEGEQLNPLDIADSERILRSLPYIRDSRILVKPGPGGEFVDILVLTQDVWTLGAEVDMEDLNAAKIDFYNKNILGSGHQQTNTVYYDTEVDEKNGYNGYYRTKNLFGAYVDGMVNYYNRYDMELIRLSVSRGFVSPQIKYAGGLTLQQTGLPPVTISTDKEIIESPIRYNYRDAWVARGLNLGFPKDGLNRTNRLILGARISNKTFIQRPQVYVDSNLTYYNYTHFLGSIALSKREYYKGSLIYNYGRTEDIPHGYLVKFTLGTTIDDYYNRLYTGIHLSAGNLMMNNGYYYSQVSAGGYLNGNRIHRGLIDFNFKYFTPIFSISDYKSRNFFDVRLTYGFNRLDTEFLDINGENGLRNFALKDLEDVNRIVLSYESVMFTPIYFLGFRFVMFGFAEFAALGNQLDFMFTEKYYTGLGLGLRIRNDNLVFRAFELKLVFFPDMPSDQTNTKYYFTNERPIEFNDFTTGGPGILTYR